MTNDSRLERFPRSSQVGSLSLMWLHMIASCCSDFQCKETIIDSACFFCNLFHFHPIVQTNICSHESPEPFRHSLRRNLRRSASRQIPSQLCNIDMLAIASDFVSQEPGYLHLACRLCVLMDSGTEDVQQLVKRNSQRTPPVSQHCDFPSRPMCPTPSKTPSSNNPLTLSHVPPSPPPKSPLRTH